MSTRSVRSGIRLTTDGDMSSRSKSPHLLRVGAEKQIRQFDPDPGMQMLGGIAWDSSWRATRPRCTSTSSAVVKLVPNTAFTVLRLIGRGASRRSAEELARVLVGDEAAESLQPIYDTLQPGMEQMGPIKMHPHAIGIKEIIGIATDMTALVCHRDIMPSVRQGSCIDCSGKSGTYDQYPHGASIASDRPASSLRTLAY